MNASIPLTATARRPSPHNRLLAALPLEDFSGLQPHLELIRLPLGWAMYESGGPEPFLYFPFAAGCS